MCAAPRLLVVDHNVRMCDSLIALLDDYHYTLHKSHSVVDAIQCIDETNYDVVILDLFMPDQDGYQILRHIEQILYQASFYPIML